MKLKIEATGKPGTGKTTSIRLIEKALRERFDIISMEIADEQGGRDVVEIVCELRR